MIFKKKSLLAMIAAMFLGSMMFIACSDDDPTGTPGFVAVTNIIGVRTGVPVGSPRELSGNVLPTNATRRDITWSVLPEYAQYAQITSGNMLTATGGTEVRVRATITRGGANENDYTQDFTIEVNSDFIAVTNITLTSATSTPVNTPLQLTATVLPADATNQAIVWSGNGVAENILTATEPGVVRVTATIAGGKTENEPFTEDFDITITSGGSGNFNPNTANVVLLDDFLVRSLTPEDDESWGLTNMNALMMRIVDGDRIGNRAGTWYALASNNGIEVMTYDGDGEVVITRPSTGGTVASIPATMIQTLTGEGEMVFIIDAENAETESYWGNVQTNFLTQNDNAVPVNISGLRGIRIQGQLKGALRVNIERTITYAGPTTNWAQWGWEIDGNDYADDYKDIDVELTVASMMGASWGQEPDITREELLTRAENITLNLNTSSDNMGARVDMRLSGIWLVFNDETSIPAEFGTRAE
ncbi:MAG: hypothetical protein FWE23_10705 [Chitinivibrionia bacterium]|nr:hypothetical protein [Chitinivibrionia bacterium]